MPARIDQGAATPPASTAQRLRVVAARIDRLSTREVLSGTLTRTQFLVLGAMARHDRLRVSDLASREGLNQTMVSRTLSGLEQSGWARRSPDPTDGRAVVAVITTEGRRLHERLQEERSALIQEYLDGLAPQAASALATALPLLEDLATHLLHRRVDTQGSP
ncbi:MarR family transcriptional regulator [Kineococcus arenarius]|uniref:MarR family transcriptional regulator n=1 Tax=unclassified Kineococcus TaxID=2621656 RepID=UPI003D7D4D57